MKKKDIIEIIALAVVIFGAVWAGIAYFASAKDLKLVEMRLDLKIIGDSIMTVNEQIWKLEDKYPGQACSTWNDNADREKYRRLKLQRDALQKKQDTIINKQIEDGG